MVYLAVSVSNQSGYCIASHTAGARNKGMTDAMFKELMAVVGMANETNRLVAGYQVEIDEQFKVWLVISRSPLANSAELRSARQPRAAVPTWLVELVLVP